MSAEPDVEVPMPARYGSPYCPECGYKCGCCCHCSCQTECPEPVHFDEYEEDEAYCECIVPCHGGHDPWDCGSFSVRYRWACEKSARLEKEEDGDRP